MNDPGSARMSAWGDLHDRLSSADAARREWLERQGIRGGTCVCCGGQTQPGKRTGYCDRLECRRAGRMARYAAQRALRAQGRKGKT